MEPAWVSIAGSNFRLGSYKDLNGQLRPCYQLTKTECLYIATKFNDEARAKLVLRWEELEMADRRRKMSEVRCLPSPQKILALADEIIGEGLRLMNARLKVAPYSYDEPAAGLGHASVVHVVRIEEIVGLGIERVAVGLPRQTGIYNGVGTVRLHVSVGVGIGAHAVLEAVLHDKS